LLFSFSGRSVRAFLLYHGKNPAKGVLPLPARSLPAPLAVRPHPHLIEIPLYPWLDRLSRQSGRTIGLGKVPDAEWDRIQQLGFDWVWLMGIWGRSRRARQIFRSDAARFASYDRALPGWTLEDIVGSPYAVADYRPDARIGSWKELDVARRKLRERGIGLMLDFVPNHTALDHPWVRRNADFYIEGRESDFRAAPERFELIEDKSGKLRFLAHGRDPYFPPWPDTAQLNLFDPGLRKAAVETVRRIARHADGVRCDMAMLARNGIFGKTWSALIAQPAPGEEYWSEVLAAAPNLVWMAETYWDTETQMQDAGFAFTYDKKFRDALREGSAGGVRSALDLDFARQQRMARFLENHDEERAGAIFAPDRIEAAATLAATAPGMRFYFHGQIEGEKIHSPVELGRAHEEPADAALQALYESLLRLADADAFHRGRWRLLTPEAAGDQSHENLIVYEWRTEQSWKVVAANPTHYVGQARVALGDEVRADVTGYLLRDELHDVAYPRSREELANGLYIRLDAGRAHIFDVRPGD
jgi:hypothetical protein